MATGWGIQLTKQIGEYLVAAELAKRGLLCTTFAGNVPEFDIIATDERGKATYVQVKTVRSASWQLNAAQILDILVEEGKQQVSGFRPWRFRVLWVFVQLAPDMKSHTFFVLTHRQAQEVVRRNYQSGLEHRKGGAYRASTHAAIYPVELSRYKDRWPWRLAVISRQRAVPAPTSD